MDKTQISQELLDSIEACFQDPEIRERSFYPEFRQAWNSVFKRAQQNQTDYFDIESDSCYTVRCEFEGLCQDFHFDQLKMAEWYEKELKKVSGYVDYFARKEGLTAHAKSATIRVEK